MKFWCVVVLCSLRIVFGCEVDDRILLCSELNLTAIPKIENLINSNKTIEDIQCFDLSHNNLVSPVNFSEWSRFRLEVLDISYNKLTFVSTENFSILKYLKVLNISNNDLSRVILSWTSLPPIELFDVSNNIHLYDSSQMFKDLSQSSITHLNLSSTNISLLGSDVFSGMSTLLSLDLSYNELRFIPNLPANLEYLDFSNNLILYIDPDCFDRDTRLKTLLLENNKNLQEIRYESFNFLVDLRKLSFKGCASLSHLPTSLFFYNKKLEYLSIAECNFRNISVSFKSSFLNMKVIELESNPWHCSSHIKWFVQLHDHHIISDKIRCATPENISLAEYLGPKVKHKVVRILLTIVSVLLFCILITAVAFSCNMENKRRKTLNSYTPLERTSKPYRGNMIYVTSSV